MISSGLRRDWNQFKLLSRDAVRQLIDTALFSRESDPMEFALWMLALVATPPAFFAARQIFNYTALVNAPIDVVEQVVVAHRLFFIIYSMLASTLLAAMTWDAIFPDGRDQEIVGVLPVRPYTFAAARLGAAVVVGAGFTAAVNVPAALIYSFIAGGHPALGNIVVLFAGHVLATMLGSLLIYFGLLVLRGFAAILLGPRAGAWLGAALQLLTVILLVEVFFFLPGVLGSLTDAMRSADPRAAAFPPVWFASLHSWVAGDSHGVMRSGIGLGVVAFLLAALATVPTYLLPARWLGRRALESRPRERAASITSMVRTVASVTAARPPVRAILIYSVASLVRSRRHLLVLATYLGVAIAISVASILLIEIRGSIKLSTPESWVLALPLVFLFFLILGLRASFRLTTEIEANWPFRLSQPTLGECVNGTALVMHTLAVLPIVAITAAATLPLWPVLDVMKIAMMQVVAGALLIECALFTWTKVPFACGHAPSPDVLKAWWPAYTLAMYLFAFKLSDWQFLAQFRSCDEQLPRNFDRRDLCGSFSAAPKVTPSGTGVRCRSGDHRRTAQAVRSVELRAPYRDLLSFSRFRTAR
jgi:hypothetical protein